MSRLRERRLEAKFPRTRVLQKYLALQEEHYALREICTEQERTLEELGGQLSVAKLAAVELREAADNAQQHHQHHQQQEGAATWANDRLVTHCKSCNREFNITRRKVIKLFNWPRILFRSCPRSLPLPSPAEVTDRSKGLTCFP